MPLTSKDDQLIETIIKKYPRSRSAIMPLLHLAQARDGHVTPESIEVIAEKLSLETAEVTAVATFYTQYKRKPVGEYHVGVCTNTLCAVMGGDAIFDALRDHLGVENDEVTSDGKVSVEHIECNANQTVQSAKDLVDSCRAGNPPAPTRGPNKLPTWKENSELLAGVNDGKAGEGVQAGDATLLGLKIAKGGK
jgi:NADH-quinone oxidoreductase subunit E